MARSQSIELIRASQFAELREEALRSPRKRAHRLFHQSDEDNPHRFLNGILRGSYVAPHRHLRVPKPESFVVLRGELGVVLFGDGGEVEACYRLRALSSTDGEEFPDQICGLDLLPGRWHSIVALSTFTVIFEVKPGPYDAATDKDFAPWAPREMAPGAEDYLAFLEALFLAPD